MTENWGYVTIFGENADEDFEKKITNYDSLGHYDNLVQLWKHFIKG